MAGYAARHRIGRVEPHLRVGRADTRSIELPTTGAAIGLDDDRPVVEAEGEPFDDWIGQRLADLRTGLSQATFYLTDPNGWR